MVRPFFLSPHYPLQLHPSRNSLFAPHCNPSDPSCLDTLTTAYHTLFSAILQTWSPRHTLSPTAFLDFVQSVLTSLPSSSSSPPMKFGETLVDMIWAIDAELDELLADAKAALAACDGQTSAANGNVSALLSKARKAKQDAERDKDTIQLIVKKLLVQDLDSYQWSSTYAILNRNLE